MSTEDQQETVTPTGDASNGEQTGAEVENNGSEATTEQEAGEQHAEQQDDGQQKREPWFQKRIGQVTREKWEAVRTADQLRQENEQLRRTLAEGGQQEGQRQPEDVQQLVKTEAQRLVESQRFDDAVGKVFKDGASEFKDAEFKSSIANLSMAGMTDDFIRVALDTDAPHKVIHHLGQTENLDEAARIFSLPPAKQARELFKLEQKLSQPATKPVSKAPAPIKPLGSGATTDTGLSDDLPIEEWMRRDRERRFGRR